jgi:microspherule protein 1
VDLSLEGPAWKVSRRQGTIRLRNNGDFFLSSEGKRPIFVDSRPILAGNKMKLNNNSVIEVITIKKQSKFNSKINVCRISLFE